jgi:hypothetical protein
MDVLRCASRRRLLGSVLGIVTLGMVSGCVESADDGESGEGQDTAGRTPTESSDDVGTTIRDDTGGIATSTATTIASADGDGLDRREANVIAVSFEGENGTYTVDVTLHHDDNGEDGYANWWQIERLDGTRLGRRKLLHPHSEQPFTRSETIDIPTDVSCVVVRGHDQTHESGGQAMLVNLDTGDTRLIDQGPTRQSFDGKQCP